MTEEIKQKKKKKRDYMDQGRIGIGRGNSNSGPRTGKKSLTKGQDQPATKKSIGKTRGSETT